MFTPLAHVSEMVFSPVPYAVLLWMTVTCRPSLQLPPAVSIRAFSSKNQQQPQNNLQPPLSMPTADFSAAATRAYQQQQDASGFMANDCSVCFEVTHVSSPKPEVDPYFQDLCFASEAARCAHHS